MKEYNFEWFDRSKAKPVGESVSIFARGIRIGEALVKELGLSEVSYVNIGMDRAQKAACIKPSESGLFLRYGKKAFREVSGTAMAKELAEVIGKNPKVSVIDGVAILTPRVLAADVKPTTGPRQDDPIPAGADNPDPDVTGEQPKRRGRPPKEPKVQPSKKNILEQEIKYKCSNCNYHKPLRGVDDRVMCVRHHKQMDTEGYCLNYEEEVNEEPV